MDTFRPTLRFKFLAIIRRTAILPYDRIVYGKASLPVPDDGSLPLVSDSDTGDMAIRDIRFCHRLLDDRRLGVPNLIRVVLYPARFREILLEWLLSQRNNSSLMIKQDSPGASGSLIDRQHIFISKIHILLY